MYIWCAKKDFRRVLYLLVRLLEVLHEHGDDHVDEDELRHEDEDDEEEGCEVGGDAAVLEAVVAVLALLAQRVLHDAVPVVAGGDPEQREEGHAERAEVRVLAEALTRVVLVTA